jgi:hypothetical protein
LIGLLSTYVEEGRSTPGKAISNDRDIQFLPDALTSPKAN